MGYLLKKCVLSHVFPILFSFLFDLFPSMIFLKCRYIILLFTDVNKFAFYITDFTGVLLGYLTMKLVTC